MQLMKELIPEIHITMSKSWALRTKSLKVYPIPAGGNHTLRISNNGKVKNVSLPNMKLIVEIGNGKHIGKTIYKQNNELYDKMEEMYLHYWYKSEDFREYNNKKNDRYDSKTFGSK